MTNAETTRLLRLRKRQAKKRPSFRRIESWRYKRVKGGWRHPKGIDSDSRQRLKSGVKIPDSGYRGPRKVRGLHPSGLIEVVITNVKDLDSLLPKKHGIKISSKIGSKKRITMIEEIQSRKFKILNLGIPYAEQLKMKELFNVQDDEDDE